MPLARKYEYRAFISYSRVDRKMSIALRSLERFILPKSIQLAAGGLDRGKRPLAPVFRDANEMVPGSDLPARIHTGLESSEFLIVLCSPAAALHSEWVRKEILDFLALGGAARILAVVIEGTPNAVEKGHCSPSRRSMEPCAFGTPGTAARSVAKTATRMRSFPWCSARMARGSSPDRMMARGACGTRAQAPRLPYYRKASGRQSAILLGHTDGVLSVTFSPDGEKVLTASKDRTSRVWDASSGKPLAVLSGHEGAVTTAIFSPDGATILTSTADQARLWDAKTHALIVVLTGHDGAFAHVSFSPVGKRVLTVSGGTLRMWDYSRIVPEASGIDLSRLVCAQLPSEFRDFRARADLQQIAVSANLDPKAPGPCDRHGFGSRQWLAETFVK